MKRFSATLIALALALTLSVPVMAAQADPGITASTADCSPGCAKAAKAAKAGNEDKASDAAKEVAAKRCTGKDAASCCAKCPEDCATACAKACDGIVCSAGCKQGDTECPGCLELRAAAMSRCKTDGVCLDASLCPARAAAAGSEGEAQAAKHCCISTAAGGACVCPAAEAGKEKKEA